MHAYRRAPSTSDDRQFPQHKGIYLTQKSPDSFPLATERADGGSEPGRGLGEESNALLCSAMVRGTTGEQMNSPGGFCAVTGGICT